MNNYQVYELYNKETKKSYIGISIHPYKRWRQHISKSKYNDWPISKSIKKHGIDSFELIILYKNLSKKYANILERILIDKLNTFNIGYNATKGGDGGNTYSKTKSNSGVFLKGCKAWNKGRSITEEERKTLKKAKKRENGERKYRRQEVIAFDKKGNLYKFKDIQEASKKLKINRDSIAVAAITKKPGGNYYWRFKNKKMSNDIIIFIDSGHGKDTKGKRSPVWPNGSQLFEHEFNLDISNRIVKELSKTMLIIPTRVGKYDIPLKDRVNFVNNIAKHFKKSLFISVHANAGGGTGFEVFTSKGNTDSDAYAQIFFDKMKEEFPDMTFRADYLDGDSDKEANFYVLRKTFCPAVLTENFFMDTYDPDCKLLLSEDGRQRIANGHVNAIKTIYNQLKS